MTVPVALDVILDRQFRFAYHLPLYSARVVGPPFAWSAFSFRPFVALSRWDL